MLPVACKSARLGFSGAPLCWAVAWVVMIMCPVAPVMGAEQAPSSSQAQQQAPPAPQHVTTPTVPHREPVANQPAEVSSGESAEPAADAGQRWPGEPGPDQAVVEGSKVRVEGGKLVAEGGVTVRTPDLTITSDRVIIDESRKWAEFTGNVSAQSQTSHSTAASLHINLDSEEWSITGGRTTVEPEFFQPGQVLEPLFLRAESATGKAKNGPIEAHNGLFTSCNLEHPHYAIQSPDITVIPENKVIIRKPAFYLFGHKIIRFPFNLVFDLTGKQNRFFPEIGQNAMEGYYAKFAYLYLAGKAGEGFLRLHLTQKRGIGLGIDHTIDTARQFGRGSIFLEPSYGALTSRITHRYQISSTLRSDFAAGYQTNSGYFGNTSTLVSLFTLNRQAGNTRTELGLQRSLSRGSYSTSDRFTLNFRQELGPANNRWTLRSVMRDSSFGADQPSDEELETELRWRRRGTVIDWEWLYQNRWDLDGDRYTGDAGRFSLNRVPALVVSTDSDRVAALNLFGRLDSRVSLYLGRFLQLPDDTKVYRMAVDGRFGGHEYRLAGDLRARHELQFRQSFYDDGSAQYATRFLTQVRRDFGSHWHTRLRYNYANTRGFAPLRLDYSGRRNDIYFEAIRLSPQHSRLELSTGLDIINGRWRDALLRYEVMTAASSKVQLQAGYSLSRSQWRPASIRWITAARDRYYMALVANYDIERSQLTRATMDLDWRWHKWWRIQLLTGYSGYSHELDNISVQLTRDLHCWVASLAYDKQMKELRLNLGLKAFPSNERMLGVGRSGARFESSMGQYY